MAEQATSAEQALSRNGSQEVSELREELDRSREEVLRLRDLLIGRDAELGALRGRLAEVEAGSARLLNAVAVLRSRVPRFALTARASLRRRWGSRG
jgi:predicted nuclease with TOPRIM domain